MIAGLVLITSGIVLFVFNLIFCLQNSEHSCYRGYRGNHGLWETYYGRGDVNGRYRNSERIIERGGAYNTGDISYPVYDETDMYTPHYPQVTKYK